MESDEVRRNPTKERYIAHCRSCSFREEYAIAALASEAAREHRARSVIPFRPPHEVVAMPLSVFERGEAELASRRLAEELARRSVHAELDAPAEPYANWRAFFESMGFRLMPVHAACDSCRRRPSESGKCLVCRGGKKPVLENWKEGGALRSGGNVGVVCGSASGGVVVVDVDDVALFGRLFGVSPEVMADRTLVVRTGRGFHVYTRAPGVGSGKLEPGVDLKGEGGYVVVPPSVHVSGTSYSFVRGSAVTERRVGEIRAVLPMLLQLSILRFHAGLRNTAPTPATPATPQHHARAAARAGAQRRPGAVAGVPEPVDLEAVADLVARQAPAFRAHWEGLLNATARDRSMSDWVLSLCLAEAGYGPLQIAWVLLRLPGSKARERGEEYARLTATKAWERKQQAMPAWARPQAVD